MTKEADVQIVEDFRDSYIRKCQKALILKDGEAFLAALGYLSKMEGMTSLSRELGLNRSQMYRSFSPTGNPSFISVMRMLDALDLKFYIVPKRRRDEQVP